MIFPKVKVMSSFYTTLVQRDRTEGFHVYDYSRVRLWTRRFDSFSCDLLLIPINMANTHWCLGAVDFKHKRISGRTTGYARTLCSRMKKKTSALSDHCRHRPLALVLGNVLSKAEMQACKNRIMLRGWQVKQLIYRERSSAPSQPQ